MDIGNIIQTARYKREALRNLRAWIRSQTDLGMKHADILEKLNAAGWVDRFGDQLELSRYHVELAIIKRSTRPRSLSVQKMYVRHDDIRRPAMPRALDKDKTAAFITPASIQTPRPYEKKQVEIRDALEDAFSDVICTRFEEGEE